VTNSKVVLESGLSLYVTIHPSLKHISTRIQFRNKYADMVEKCPLAFAFVSFIPFILVTPSKQASNPQDIEDIYQTERE
jgi:hypothetical protein